MSRSKWRQVFRVGVATLLLALMTLGTASSASAAVKAKTNPLTVEGSERAASATSNFLAIQVGANGIFNSGATGTITGKTFGISYAWPSSPWSSFATVRVDGADTKYGSSDGAFTTVPTDIDATTNQSVWRWGSVEVTQRLEIVTGTSTGRADTGLYRYTLRNTDTVPHTVGLRLMIDTYLEGNDACPFRVPGTGNVTTETDYTGAAIPEYWQAFRDLEDTAIMAQGTLRGGASTVPDRFSIANWGGIYGTTWDYTITAGESTGDSAVGMWWNPVTLAPGQSRTITTFYGLGTVSGTTNPTLTGPVALSIVDGAWSPNPFTVTAYLANGTAAELLNTPITLMLPAGLEFATGETARHSIASIPASETGVSSWSVRATGARTLTYSVTAIGVTASRSVFVPGGTIPCVLAVSSRSVNPLGYGAAFPVRGTLKAAGIGLTGQRVILQAAAPGGAFRDTAYLATTGTGGAFAFSVRPTVRTYYRVRFAGSPAYAAAGPTAAIFANPRARVTTPVAPSTMRRTRYYTVYGYLTPRHTARTYPVRIYKWRKIGRTWRSQGFVVARASNYSSITKYAQSMKLSTRGTWRLRALAPADNGHAATWSSGYDYVTVR